MSILPSQLQDVGGAAFAMEGKNAAMAKIDPDLTRQRYESYCQRRPILLLRIMKLVLEFAQTPVL